MYKRLQERTKVTWLRLPLIAVVSILSFFGCASQLSKKIDSPATAPASNRPWKPVGSEISKPVTTQTVKIPDQYQGKLDWSLAELIDVALLTNNDTRAAWFQARAQAAEMESLKGAYYPSVDLTVDTTRIKGSAVGGRFSFNQSSTRPYLELNWILIDFGKRGADVDEARQTLYATNLIHNAIIQNVILEVQQAYYEYLNAKALLQAQEASVHRAITNLDAANQRHEAGVATIADVLQAKTASSQAQLFLDTTRGAIQILRGTLAVAIGVPPSEAGKLDVVDELPSEITVEQTSERVEALVRKAFENRPDLAAERSTVIAAQAHVKSLQAERYPKIELSANADRLTYLDPINATNNYVATLGIRFPLFNGFSREYDVLQAKAEAEAARARLARLQQQVGLQAWTSYFNLKTAGERIITARSLLQSAQESYDVAQGRYQEGVGSILDLLTAQSALAAAKAQEVQTRTEWLLAVAQLAHDTGTLGLAEEQSRVPKVDEAEK